MHKDALCAKSDTERAFDGVGVGMGFGELLGGALDVGTHVLELRRNLLLQGKLLDVDGMVRVGSHSRVGVLLPGVGLRPADDDLDAVVLDGAGEGLTQATFGDEGLDGFLYLRTERFEGFFGLVAGYLCCKKLINNFIIFHNSSAFVSNAFSVSGVLDLAPYEWVKKVN